MFDKKPKKIAMSFRPTEQQEKQIRTIAEAYEVSITDVIVELLTTDNTLDGMTAMVKAIESKNGIEFFNAWTEKNNSDSINSK